MFRLKRIYEPAEADDGYRVLVERLWPRGLRKADAHLDAWAKVIAPSTDLRRWYGHDPEKWESFQQRYQQELEQPEPRQMLDELVERARTQTVTLLYATHEVGISNAEALYQLLTERLEHHT